MPGKSKDPVQQKLRDHKSKWNSDVSSFISKLIAFKRGVNGRGDAKFGLPVSKIQDPFPQSIPQTLSLLTSEYEKLAKEAVSIISEQENYSKTRRKKKQASSNYQLETNAGKISRFWAYLKAPFLDEDNKKHRIALLRTLAEIDDDLVSFQETLVSKSFTSLQKVSNIYSKLENKIKFVRVTVDYLKIKTGPDVSGYIDKFNNIKYEELPYMEAICEYDSDIVSRWSADKIRKNIGEFFYYLRENPKATVEELAEYIQKVDEEYKSELKEANIKADLTESSFKDMARRLGVSPKSPQSGKKNKPSVEREITEDDGELSGSNIDVTFSKAEEEFNTIELLNHDFPSLLNEKDVENISNIFKVLKNIYTNDSNNTSSFNKQIQKFNNQSKLLLDSICKKYKLSKINSFEDLYAYIHKNPSIIPGSKSAPITPPTPKPPPTPPPPPAPKPPPPKPADPPKPSSAPSSAPEGKTANYYNSPALEKNANVVSRWLKKKIHELSPLDKTSALRLDAFEKAENSREILKEILGDLEEDLDIVVVNQKIKQLEFSFNAIKYVVNVLSEYHSANAYKYEEKEKDTGVSSFFKSKK